MNQERLQKVYKMMQDESLRQMIVTSPATIFYLTGKWYACGERMLVLYLHLEHRPRLFLNELFTPPCDSGLDVVSFKDTDQPVAILSRFVEPRQSVGVDKTWPSGFLLGLQELLPGNRYLNCSGLLDHLRMCKDAGEIALMQKASVINDQAMIKLIGLVGEGCSEIQLAKALLPIYEQMGAVEFSFPPIVSFGANGADPHHQPDKTVLKAGDSIVIDIGCRYRSYCSDMTRTLFYKHVPPEAQKIYSIVLAAHDKAIAAVKPGARFCEIDQAARSMIAAAGYGKYFTHRTGHSIGLETHDFGDVSSANPEELKPGMIFSVEPGIYLPGQCGVRIEDLVLVTPEGHQVLNAVSRSLQVMD